MLVQRLCINYAFYCTRFMSISRKPSNGVARQRTSISSILCCLTTYLSYYFPFYCALQQLSGSAAMSGDVSMPHFLFY